MDKIILPTGLYPVISDNFCKGRDIIFVLEEVIKGGAKIVQLRLKDISKKEFYNYAHKFREITKKNNILLIINDHIDIALAVNADGVHLGQDDLPCNIAKKIAPNLIIGISTHNFEEIENAEKDGASYINIGPIYSTNTKKLSMPPLGLDYLKDAKSKTKLPFSVMGGIKKDHLKELVKLGAKTIAMVTEITEAQDISKKTYELAEIIKENL